MSREEFQEFINSFGKKPGEYTKDEMYQIGAKHKTELAQEDKSWAILTQVLGWKGSSDSFRAYVNRRLLKEAVSSDEVLSNEDELYRNLYIEKQKIRDTYTSYKRDIRDEARIQVLKEELIESIKVLPALPKVESPTKKSNSYKEAVLTFADLHLGPDFKNSVNEYSYEIAVKRCQKIVDETVRYCRALNVRKLHFLNMGDLIMGLIHPTIRLEQTLDVTDQIMKAAELVSEVLNQLQAAAPIITYRSVVDNHARATPNKNEHIEKENFNKIIDWFVEERLKDTTIHFLHDNIDDGIGKFSLDNGKKVMFAHGHQDSADKSFQNFFGVTREFIDYIVLAHYHNSKEKTFNGMKVFVTGSIIGTDSYAYGKRLFSDPEQKLLIFDEDDDVIDITINLKNA